MKQSTMKGYAMQGIGKTGWIEKEVPACGPIDAICRPIAVAPCTSDVHTVWAGAIGNRKDLILGHEAVAEVVEVGKLVKEFRPGRPSDCTCHYAGLGIRRSSVWISSAQRQYVGRLEVFQS